MEEEVNARTKLLEKKAEWLIPIRTVSEANSSEHWSKKHKRHKSQKTQVYYAFHTHMPKISFPCIVKLTRISARSLDSDNLVSAFKWIRDEIAAKLTGNNTPGRADDDSRISWEYSQKQDKEQAVLIEIFH